MTGVQPSHRNYFAFTLMICPCLIRFVFLIGGIIVNSGELDAADSLGKMLQHYCAECHGAKTQEAELDFTRYAVKPELLRDDWRVLTKIIAAVESNAMPPADADRVPPAQDRAVLLKALKQELDLLAEAQRDEPGTVAITRLSRHEYRNVLRDLSGGIVADAGRMLPQEGGAGEGFSNVGEAQGMTALQVEKYLEAAKGALKHLRVTPQGFVWNSLPREPVDDPAAARKEVTDDIIAWHIAQQQKWGEEHRNLLQQKLGLTHAAYLEAAWRYQWRKELGLNDAPLEEMAWCSVSPVFQPKPADNTEVVILSRVALQKWWDILQSKDANSPFRTWATAWRALPGPTELDAKQLRAKCMAIVSGETTDGTSSKTQEYAPAYELSFHETKEEVLAAAKEGYWPFRIEIGDATELFFVVTDAGDGNQGEYAIWHKGRFQFKDGTAKPWQEVTTVVGANSGREFAFGTNFKNGQKLPPDSIGVQPPGALKIKVPQGATLFELELALDGDSVGKSSVQALVLREKPTSQSYISGRPVFGGKPSTSRAAKGDLALKEREQRLRKRNLAEANRTKIGLNAERNVFAHWTETKLEHIGGPWPDQEAEKDDRLAPYFFTVEQVHKNASGADLAQLRILQERLISVAQVPQQEFFAALKAAGAEDVKEGCIPKLEEETAKKFQPLIAAVEQSEQQYSSKVHKQLVDFARHAWRRPLTDNEAELLQRLYQQGRAQGLSLDSSAKTALLTVLASPHFLYRGDLGHHDDATASLNNYNLAARLSFFLWASIPDEELLQLAQDNSLQNIEVLKAQTRRMLRDPRAVSLATDFASQLWGFADFEQFTGPDAERFPEFTPALRTAMREEVVRFLDDLFRQDRPLTLLLDADYTYVNQALAKHYGLTANPEWSRVSLPTERGGLATMGLFLTKTSLPLRTSPVQRGVWVMEQLLGRELPNPPPVNPLSADDKSAEGLNIRQQLERHRAEASCARCHDRIDPLGISLENFDPIGRWRNTERDGSPVTNTAQSEEGRELAGSKGLKQYLVSHRAEFFQHFNRKLLGYALGRATQPGDRWLLERLQQRLTATDYRLAPVVEEIVTSNQFRGRGSIQDSSDKRKP